MNRAAFSLLAMLLFASAAPAQIRRATAVVYGDATLTANPDQVKVTVSVTTRASSAVDAAGQNATSTSNLIAGLQQVLGAKADIKTVGYSVAPVYSYPANGTPILQGYTATNSLEVTMNDINQAGRVIDAAVQSGATNVQSLRFSLKDDRALRNEALKQAGINARAKADAIAASLGKTVGAVVAIQEGYNSTITTSRLTATTGATNTTTPVEAGLVTISASVTLEMELN